MSRLCLTLAVCAIFCPSRADAALIGLSSSFGSGGGGIYSINPTTGAATLLSTTTTNTSLVGLEFLSGTLYGSDIFDPSSGFAVASINPLTGATTFVSDQGGSANWHGLAGDESAGLLYSVDQDADNALVSLNPITGVITVIGATGAPMAGLAYDDANDILYGASQSGSLYTINTLTGASQLIGALGFSSGIVGLAYDEFTGTLFANNASSLYTVNVATGAGTLVGANGVSNIDGLTWIADTDTQPVPEPASLTLLGLGLAGMAGRRWRQRKAS